MLTSIGDVPLEEVTVDGAQKTFSNNVGYLHSKFYIAPETSPPERSPASPILSIQNVQVTPAQSTPGERVIISADILAGGAPAEAVHVLLYPDAQTWQAHQDDPSLPKPRAFDVEMLPYIRADESDPLEVPYRPQSCGTQEVLIWATVGAGADAVTATATVDNGACALYLPVVISGILE